MNKSLLLASLVAVAALVGCNKKDPEVTNNVEVPAETAAPAADASAPVAETAAPAAPAADAASDAASAAADAASAAASQ